MSWLLLMALISGTAEVDEKTVVTVESPAEPVPDQQPEPNIELLLFLAEWEDSDNNQWLDPEIFATDDTMNQHLDKQKVKQNETDPDHY